MFKRRIIQPTDQDLTELLATAGMGWSLHGVSGHRPDSRDVPHAWRWLRDRVHIMVYLGGDGPEANVEFDPLNDAAAAAELVTALKAKDIHVDGWDLATPEGRRSTCEAAAEKLRQLPPPPPPPDPLADNATVEATVTAHTLPEGEEFPPPGLIAKDQEEDRVEDLEHGAPAPAGQQQACAGDEASTPPAPEGEAGPVAAQKDGE